LCPNKTGDSYKYRTKNQNSQYRGKVVIDFDQLFC